MIAISSREKEMYGCPYCGCEIALTKGSYGCGTLPVVCIECEKDFVILADGLTKSNIGFGTGKVDANGKTIYEYPELCAHPRKGIPSHKYVEKDVKPEYGDYCSPRGVGYDLACFVKTKIAGERITTMMEEYKDRGISCRLDYRPNEPKWIQVKFSAREEAREYFLDGKLRENNSIITKELVEEVVTMPINYTNKNKYCRGFSFASWYDLKYALEDYDNVKENKPFSMNDIIRRDPMDFYQRLGLYFTIDIFKNKDEYSNCKLLSSYLSGTNDEYSYSSSKDINNQLKNLIDLYNEEFNTQIKYEGKCRFNIYRNFDYTDYRSIFSDVEFIKSVLRKLDYSEIEKLLSVYHADNEEELNKIIEDVDVNKVYPLFTLFGLLSKLTKRDEKNADSVMTNQFNARQDLELLAHVANVQIENNPYQEVFDMIKDKLEKYRKPEEKAKQNIIK